MLNGVEDGEPVAVPASKGRAGLHGIDVPGRLDVDGFMTRRGRGQTGLDVALAELRPLEVAHVAAGRVGGLDLARAGRTERGALVSDGQQAGPVLRGLQRLAKHDGHGLALVPDLIALHGHEGRCERQDRRAGRVVAGRDA